MDKQSQTLVTQLEAQIKELTQANQQLQNNVSQLEISVQLGYATSSASDINILNKKIVGIIKGYFGFYHVGLYLLDKTKEWAILAQAAGKASRKMKIDRHRLPISQKSAAGWINKNCKPYLSYPSGQQNGHDVQNMLLPGAHSEVALPLIIKNRCIGILDIQSVERQAFSPADIVLFQSLANQIAPAIEKTQLYTQTLIERDSENWLYRFSSALTETDDIDTITSVAISLSDYLNAAGSDIYLKAMADNIYFKSSTLNIDTVQQQELVNTALNNGPEAHILKTKQALIISDTHEENHWHLVKHNNQMRSFLGLPIIVDQGRLTGVLSFVHSDPNYFNQNNLELLETLTPQIITALHYATHLIDVESSLQEARLMLDISRRFSGASTLNGVYDALVQSILAIGADRCTLYTCDELDADNTPTYGQIVFVGDKRSLPKATPKPRFLLTDYPTLLEAVYTQETLVIKNVQTDERLTKDRDFLLQFGATSIVINPLVVRSYAIGLLSIEYRDQRTFTERELALYRTLSNQTTVAIKHVEQIKQTEEALAETQTLYRAGRVLAAAADLQSILEEALIEFVYSLGLDQGGITLLTSNKQFGQLMAYLEDGQLQDIEKLRFAIDENIPYQKMLLNGQPFVSSDVANDPRLVDFDSFNAKKTTTALLEAPIIINGETVGWIGVDAVEEAREFRQRETDLARAMSDQIAIAIQNRRLLEQTEHQAKQLKTVATVGEAVTDLTELGEVLKTTVNLIRDQFDFYHASIFLIDDAREWAVVQASTGEVGKIMVEKPHRLGVGSNSIVGYVTAQAKPRIALDVGKDAVHFDNPLLPKTRSEMGLPLVSRGMAIGALDVQSVEANAFTDDDIETLQIMADQLVTAIENARLFEQTQRRLIEQAMLYRIGTKIGGTLNLQETTDILAKETAEALDVAECVLTLLEDGNIAYVISDFVQEDSSFDSDKGQHFKITEFESWPQILKSKQEYIIHIDEPGNRQGWEFEYLKNHQGVTMAVVPILLRNEVIGLLEVYDNKQHRHFKQEDISLLDSIALQAANAIENARLFEAARESQTFMKAIIDEIPDPIFIKDGEHKWVVVNRAFTEDILGQSEENLIGHDDSEFLPKEEVDKSWEDDDKLFETGKIQEGEESITDHQGNLKIIYTRKIPLTLTQGESKPEYLIGIINDITQRKQREVEREQLIEQTQKTLERTQTLYRISDILAATAESDLSGSEGQKAIFEVVLGEYLQLLGSKQGSIMLFDNTINADVARARYVDGSPVEPHLVLPLERDKIFQHLQEHPKPLIIKDAANNPLTKNAEKRQGQERVISMLFIPLMIRGKLVGSIVVDVIDDYVFTQDDIEIGEAIADQLNIWLENRQLLIETQYRSNLLQTAAEVSRASSSILDVDVLITSSVNLIRDQFDFYYVGMFLVNEAREWAVLRSGTGEAGRIQLERHHQLKIGGESMIGQCIATRKARIALDVGEEAARFKNPILPDTHSEMALPLISRDKAIGALTVQSVQRSAFSNEDITLLQTMADQLANVIENASLFSQTQEALAEAETLYQVTQELSSARDEDGVYQLAIDALAGSGVDSCAIYMYLDDDDDDTNSSPQRVEQKAIWTTSGKPAFDNGLRLQANDFVIEELIPHQGVFLIKDLNNSNITERLRRILKGLNITSIMALPLSTYQKRLGFLLAAYSDKNKTFTQNQTRLFTTIAQQMVVALDNLRLIKASQRRARREEIIREITSKIRTAVGVDDILKTTVSELGKVVGTSRGSISLNVSDSLAQLQNDNRVKNSIVETKETIGDKESENYGQ